jgi:ATP-dependent Lhr-like helicase
MLDLLCLSGEVGWGRGITLYAREHAGIWTAVPDVTVALSADAQRIVELLRTRGASFARDLGPQDALDELVAAGLITSDGFLGRRGRWSLLEDSNLPYDDAVETKARILLKRYGVIFRRLLTRESNAAPWRDLARVYRRLEARGEIRGGRFVTGMSGEQFALPEAIERLREIRRQGPDGRLVVISAADPLNLVGILTSGERVRAVAANRIAYRDGLAVSVMEGDYLRPLAELESAVAMDAAAALAGRRVPVISGFVGR